MQQCPAAEQPLVTEAPSLPQTEEMLDMTDPIDVRNLPGTTVTDVVRGQGYFPVIAGLGGQECVGPGTSSLTPDCRSLLDLTCGAVGCRVRGCR